MPLYSHTTFGQLKTDLLDSLGDSVFWTDAEAGLYVKEALRVWGATTQRWKTRENVPLVQDQHWYDLYADSTQLNPTVTDQDLLQEIQYMLLESVSASSWPGTAMFNLTVVQDAMQDILNEVYAEALPVITQQVVNVPITDFHDLSSITPHVIHVRRAAWKTAAAVYSLLWRSDEDEKRYYQAGFESQPLLIPQEFSTNFAQPLQLRLLPRPGAPGQMDLLLQKAAPTLDLTTGVELGIPDDLAWVVKYGVLASLLDREGMGTDQARAAYCKKRYEDGLELAKAYSSVLAAELNGVHVSVDSVQEMDAYTDGWQNDAASTPGILGMAGYNLFAVAPKPDAGPNSALLTIVDQAPIPSADGDQVQLGSDELEAVLGYAQHLASFKQGGAEFNNTGAQLAEFFKAAEKYNSRLSKTSWAKRAQDERTWKERVYRPSD